MAGRPRTRLKNLARASVAPTVDTCAGDLRAAVARLARLLVDLLTPGQKPEPVGFDHRNDAERVARVLRLAQEALHDLPAASAGPADASARELAAAVHEVIVRAGPDDAAGDEAGVVRD